MNGVRLNPEQRSAFFAASKMLRDRGFADLAKVAAQRLQPTMAAAPTVVVVGEVKRGKSSLINALLGRPGLSPVGVEVTTGAYLTFLPPTADFGPGRTRLVTSAGRPEIPPGELADWVTAEGRRTVDPDAPLLRGAEVSVEGRHLPGIALIDTPGVGGLSGAHAGLARHAASGASLLVFVCDAGAPLSAPELEFLQSAAASTESVLLAMTKVDRYPQGWREVLAANHALLARYAPRFADAEIVAVANPFADEAAEIGDADLAGRLLEASGIPRLVELIGAALADTEQVQIANAMRTLLTGLDQIEAQFVARREAATGSPEVRANLEAERTRLEELRNQQARWTLDLDRDLGGVRSQAVTAGGLHFTELKERWTARIAGDKRAMLPSGRRQMMAEMTADFDRVAGVLADGFYRHLHQVVQDLFQDHRQAGAVLEQTSSALHQVQSRERALRPSGVSFFDPTLATTALFGAGMAKGMLGVGAAGFFAPVVLAVGGAWLAVNMTHRVIKGGRSQLQTWMVESSAAVQADLVTAADTVIREFRPEIIVAFRDWITQQSNELKATLREAELAEAASVKDRQDRIASLDRHLAAVAAMKAEVTDAVRSRPGRTSPAPAGTSAARSASK